MIDEAGRTRNTEAADTVVRGVSRLMHDLGETCLSEFTLKTGRRVDLIALNRKGAFTVIEVKTSVADYRSDNKWHDYLDFCDRFYFAVPMAFPIEILPPECDSVYAGPVRRAMRAATANVAQRCRWAREAALRMAPLRRLPEPVG